MKDRTPLGQVHRRKEMSVEGVLDAVRAHQRVLAGDDSGTVLKRSQKTRVTILDQGGAYQAEPLCVKEFVRSGLRRLLPRFIRHRPAMVSWKVAHGLEIREISAAKALAVVMGRGASSYLIMRAVSPSRQLAAYAQSDMGPGTATARRRRFLRAGADCLQQCYEAGVHHQDLKAGNVVVQDTGSGGWRFVLLDLAAVRFVRPVPLRAKLMNLAQLNASTPLAITWTDRLRFLRYLARNDPRLGDRAGIEEISRVTRRRRCAWAR